MQFVQPNTDTQENQVINTPVCGMEKVKILIVEDDSIIAMFTREILSRKGYNVLNAVSTAEEALNIVQKESPDLILMDITLDGPVDGIEATRKILCSSSVPVIFITANTDDHTLKRAKDTGAFGLLRKPFMPKDLYSSVNRAIKRIPE